MTDISQMTFDEAADLFLAARARASDPDTSHDAARAVSGKVKYVQALVLDYAASKPDGFTDVDLNAHFDSTASTYRSRRAELVERGLIKDSGERVLIGKSGRRHVLWVITLEGIKANG